MKIAIWKTGHEIADTVAETVYEGLSKERECTLCDARSTEAALGDINIGYGILRGNAEIFRRSGRDGKPWFNLDRGYWQPNHYDGYYRISLCGTQQTFGLDKLEPDYERWDKLGIEIFPTRSRNGRILNCPATKYVKDFLCKKYTTGFWHQDEILREKDCVRPLQEDLDECGAVVTFNSSVGWEALRQGIPVVSDPQHSIVGAYQKLLDRSIHNDLDERRKLFGIMAGLQLSLDEVRQGRLWPVIQKLLSIYSSDGIAAKP